MLGASEKLIVKRFINGSADGKFGRIRRFWEKYYGDSQRWEVNPTYAAKKKK